MKRSVDRSYCAVCGEPLPPPARTGRPREYCSGVCTERARTRRQQAARLLDYADRIETDIGRPGFGSPEHLRARAAEIRERAEGLLQGIPR